MTDSKKGVEQLWIIYHTMWHNETMKCNKCTTGMLSKLYRAKNISIVIHFVLFVDVIYFEKEKKHFCLIGLSFFFLILNVIKLYSLVVLKTLEHWKLLHSSQLTVKTTFSYHEACFNSKNLYSEHVIDTWKWEDGNRKKHAKKIKEEVK